MYRTRGLMLLGSVISSDSNVKKLERKVNDLCQMQDEYMLMMQEIANKRRSGMSCKDIMTRLKSGRYLETSEEYDVFRKKIDEHDAFLVKPFEVEEGVLECGKCNSNRTLSYTKQTRGGDESTTVFAVCYDCNNRWKM